MEALVLLALVGVLIMVPLMIVKVLFQVLFGLVLLPFKLVGGLFKAAIGLVGGLFSLVFGGAVAVGTVLLVVGTVLLLPFLPFLVLGGLVWLVVKAAHPVARAV